MILFKDEYLEDGAEYFCVKDGIVYHLTARDTGISGTVFFTLFLEDVHGNSVEMFHAHECSLIYKL